MRFFLIKDEKTFQTFQHSEQQYISGLFRYGTYVIILIMAAVNGLF